MEKWVDIKGYEGLYMISDQGNIKALGINISVFGRTGIGSALKANPKA